MNVLIINLDKAVFGVVSPSRERLVEYSSLVDKLFVIAWTHNQEKPIFVDDKLFIYPTNSDSRLFYFSDTSKIAKKILKENKIDLIVTQDPFETGLCGWRLAKKHKIPLQIQIHTDFLSPYFASESLKNKFRVWLAKFLIKKAGSVRVVSERIKKSIISQFPNFLISKIFVLPIFADTEKFRLSQPKFDLKQKFSQFEQQILVASRLSPEKNIGLAIRAFFLVLKKYPKAGLVIVGKGSEEDNLKNAVQDLKINSNVIFEPWTDELVSYYKSADVFLLSSNYEGWGMSVAEAMAAGCPVVMTDVGCAGELVKNDENGLVAPVGDADVLADSILKILGDKEFAQKIALAGRQTAKAMMSKEEYLRRLKESWHRLPPLLG